MEKKYKIVRDILLAIYQNQETLKDSDKELQYKLYLKMIRELAYKGYADAQYDLAQHYEDMNICGMPNPYLNIKKRLYWYKKAAYQNHSAAYNNLADMLERGEGCRKDLNIALEYYKRAADLGDSNGKHNYKLLLKQLKSNL